MAHPSNSSPSIVNSKSFEVITAVLLKFFWVVTVFRLVNVYRNFEVYWCPFSERNSLHAKLFHPNNRPTARRQNNYIKFTYRMPDGRLTYPIILLNDFPYNSANKKTLFIRPCTRVPTRQRTVTKFVCVPGIVILCYRQSNSCTVACCRCAVGPAALRLAGGLGAAYQLCTEPSTLHTDHVFLQKPGSISDLRI
jgi:hypothetical protein